MCKIGDIIVIDSYIGDDFEKIEKHSFVVISDKTDFIEGLNYDFVANVISSFKSEEHKIKKLKYKENLSLNNDSIINKKIKKPSYIKADKLFYFNKDKIDYFVFGRISDELLNDLVNLIIELSNEKKLVEITTNL